MIIALIYTIWLIIPPQGHKISECHAGNFMLNCEYWQIGTDKFTSFSTCEHHIKSELNKNNLVCMSSQYGE